VNQALVEEIIARAGGCLIDIRQEGSIRRSRVSLFYTAVRKDHQAP